MKINVLTFFVLIFCIACNAEGLGKEEKLYIRHCANCHGSKGEGLKKLIPPLANADYVIENHEKLACIIKHGMQGSISVNGVEYNGIMPSNYLLSDAEIVNIINYISKTLNEQKEVSLKEVQTQLSNCN